MNDIEQVSQWQLQQIKKIKNNSHRQISIKAPYRYISTVAN